MDLFRVVLQDRHEQKLHGPYDIWANNKRHAFETAVVIAHRPAESPGGGGVPITHHLLLAEPIAVLRPVLSF